MVLGHDDVFLTDLVSISFSFRQSKYFLNSRTWVKIMERLIYFKIESIVPFAFTYIFIFSCFKDLFERHSNNKMGKIFNPLVHPLHQSATVACWAWKFIWVSHVNYHLCHLFHAHECETVRNRAVRIWTGTLLWNADTAGSGLTEWTICQPSIRIIDGEFCTIAEKLCAWIQKMSLGHMILLIVCGKISIWDFSNLYFTVLLVTIEISKQRYVTV